MTNGQYELGSGKALANGEKAPFAVLANTQRKGRGRLGRTGKVRKGGNLYFSMGFRPDVELIKLRSFTLWQGLKIAMLLHSLTGIEGISVKWPNDLVYDKKKIGGMLTEASIDCERVRSLVFGLGLNVNCPKSRFSASLAKTATSLKARRDKPFGFTRLQQDHQNDFGRLQECVTGGVESALLEKWSE